MVETRRLSIPGSEDRIALSTAVTVPQEEPKAVIQLVHGMSEHKERYLPMMEYLSERGFVCVMNDLRGHGETARSAEDLGFLGKGGFRGMTEDVHKVTRWCHEAYPGLPVYLFGHSMGSMIVRSYCKQHDADIAGLIVCGSPSRHPAAGAGKLLARCIRLFKGERYRSHFLASLSTGSYARKFRKEGSPNAWLCSDPSVIRAFENDPLCGFIFTVNGYIGLFGLMQDIYSPKGWEVRRPELPVLFIAGAQDPCIGSLHKFSEAVSFLRNRGYRQVNSKIYPKMRHAIHHEAGKEAVWADIANTVDAWRQNRPA